ncbi:uncharacterized protein LOC105446335 [Strongylocentrotus purpuratus]|uniref:Death domain-containing protein n=1 Tax=Strongylocentrotus purpuratus TaxID=7668 RepID=A0A7M7PCP5_STRPU|nr:uncharacterized protein LOC105446335 [Strongylocentrotus purpuratus]
MTAPREESEGRYLKVKVLDFFDRRLAGGLVSWRQLGKQLDFTSMDVEKLESDGLKIDQSSVKLLLRNWECREGGCNVELLKKSLAEIGRNDILWDLRAEYENQGIELVESRSYPRTIGRIPLGDGEVLLVGKGYNVRDFQLQEKRKLDPEPVIRTDLSTSGDQSWGGGSMDSTPGSNSPKNFRKSTRAVS